MTFRETILRETTSPRGSTSSQLVGSEKDSCFGTYVIAVFELVSAYGTVGLSLGIPDVRSWNHLVLCPSSRLEQQNYSFSGALRPLSKLIICLVMLRGRHRGLPVAIDRAVLLPSEFARPDPERNVKDETHVNRETVPEDVDREDGASSGETV